MQNKNFGFCDGSLILKMFKIKFFDIENPSLNPEKLKRGKFTNESKTSMAKK